MNLISRDYLFSTAGSKLQYALSNPNTDGPFSDRYWLVRYCTFWVSDVTAENLGLWLVSSAAYVQLTQAIATAGGGYRPDYSSGAAGAAPPISGIHKLAPGDGGGFFGQWRFTTAQSFNCGTNPNNTGEAEFFVPSGWAIYGVEITGAGSASARSILMRIAYNEIMNGCSPDSSW